jgi:hypothetical protein
VVMVEGRVELVRPMDPAAVDDHHDLFASFLEGSQHLVEILAQLLGIKVRHDFIADFRGAILDGADDVEQHPARDTTPRAVLHPRLAFAAFLAFAVARAQGTGGPTRALGAAPPAQPGQGKAPHDRFVGIEQNAFAPARPILQGRECNRTVGERSRGGIEPSSGAAVAERFFKTQRTLSRPNCTPVCCARTVASS